MPDYKLDAATAAATMIIAGQTIGLGGGQTIAYLAEALAASPEMMDALTVTSSSFDTTVLLYKKGFRVVAPALISRLDLYFDGCDVFDKQLNALKSGGGIHVTEKILAGAANRFVLLGDASKYQHVLDPKYPIALEILPQALEIVRRQLQIRYPDARFVQRVSTSKTGAVVSDNGNLLADLHFDAFPALPELDIQLNMIPGIAGHSLFYNMAHQAIIAGESGVQYIDPA
ncbi:ribose 5-phosphate isomerase A [Chitinophaga rhizophila]|uniref:Ribose 5-phosphate isomerase A n=1 Tax=Chitinophaga rhizophila TaxID=2866212 RepID=A0ABS7GJ42_9BACT|nr:ribose 5-phosphate isomerase A [Chitinophaga rhizophila]MBW8687155.1 ribose 5-phosphate isomerase A [Chitinophaga rhizophila]